MGGFKLGKMDGRVKVGALLQLEHPRAKFLLSGPSSFGRFILISYKPSDSIHDRLFSLVYSSALNLT